MKLVYLAGPITGLDYEGATNWRQDAIKHLMDISGGNIVGLSPMRGKDYLIDEKTLAAEGYSETIMSSAKGITERDRFDTTRADALFVNLLGAERVSIGTMIELGWADANRIPIIVVMEKGNLHDHAMVNSVASFVVNSLGDGMEIIHKLFIEEIV